MNQDQYQEVHAIGEMKKSVDAFLHVNHLTGFQKKAIPILLDPEAGPEEYCELILMLDRKVAQLMDARWEPKREDGDKVHRPTHYDRFSIEPTYFAMENGLDWCRGNALKYIVRFPYKNGIEDLRKAQRYVAMYVKWLDGDKDWSK